MDKVFIFGGSFDPIHMGHLILAQHCGQTLNARVVFLPTGNPPHKTILTSSEHRFQMLHLAVKDNPNFEVCTYEIEKTEISYTYKTLQYLKEIYGNNIYFFVGGDSLLDIPNWREPESILEQCTLVYAQREGYSVDIDKYLRSRGLNSAKVKEIETPIIEISSTDIRLNVKKGNSIKYLVPQQVENYIYQHKLYK